MARKIPEAIRSRRELPGGIIEYTYDRGSYGTTTVRVIPADDQSPEALAEGHARVQRALRRLVDEQIVPIDTSLAGKGNSVGAYP